MRFCLSLMMFCAPIAAFAGEYKLGAGVLFASQPHYPGADQAKLLVLPLPFFTYQSERLNIDRQGATGLLTQGEGWTLNLSLSGSLPVNSSDNRLRQGMSSLDWVGEAGPALDIQINDAWLIRFPLRLAVAGDFQRLHAIGQRFEPELRYNTDLNAVWQWQMTTSLAWSSRQYHQYFYGVPADFETADRAVYQAKSGFSGWRLSNGLVYQQRDWWFGIYTRYDNFEDAAFVDSPLFRKAHQISTGLVLVRIFSQGNW